jgi:hypothetical protein
MVPLQRQIIASELERQHEEAQDRGAGGPTPPSSGKPGFSNSPPTGNKKKETVKYINESEKDG